MVEAKDTQRATYGEPSGGLFYRSTRYINRAINLKIKQKSDLEIYGKYDVWSSPAIAAGDCDAIAKFVALQEARVPASDLRIVILRDDIRKVNYAVVAARLDGSWLMLDNRHMKSNAIPAHHRLLRARADMSEP